MFVDPCCASQKSRVRSLLCVLHCGIHISHQLSAFDPCVKSVRDAETIVTTSRVLHCCGHYRTTIATRLVEMARLRAVFAPTRPVGADCDISADIP